MSRAKLPMLRSRVVLAQALAPTMQPGSWRTGGQTTGRRGYDYHWQKARAAFLREHPFYVYCLRELRIASTAVSEVIVECAARALPVPYGNVVHHIKPHRGDRALFWDQKNWQTCCATHHSRDKQREENLCG